LNKDLSFEEKDSEHIQINYGNSILMKDGEDIALEKV